MDYIIWYRVDIGAKYSRVTVSRMEDAAVIWNALSGLGYIMASARP